MKDLNQGRSIGHAFRADDNNFDRIRLLAALAVMLSHSYDLNGLRALEPLAGRWMHRSGATLAVCSFFVVSGFLVVRSLERNDIGAYVAARALRIFPGLAAVLLLQTFILGPAFTTLAIVDYLAHPAIREGLRSLWPFDLSFALPGVFEGNPWAGAVNGSLWTLPIEIAFYLLLPWLAIASLLGRRLAWFPLLVLATLRWHLLSSPQPWRPLLRGVPFESAVDFALLFWMGAMLWVYRQRVPASAGLACAAIALLSSASDSALELWIFYVAFPYLVIYAGTWRPVARPSVRSLDLSYGVYLYAFPVQQSLVALLGPMAPWRLSMLAVPVTLVLAWLSWRLVEAPCLALKNRFGRPREPGGAKVKAPG